ncbi:hypothetical protein BH23GEM9_BH23GEM9_34610 [soil metagenome]
MTLAIAALSHELRVGDVARVVLRPFLLRQPHVAPLDDEAGQLGVRHLRHGATVDHTADACAQFAVAIIRVGGRQAEPVA